MTVMLVSSTPVLVYEIIIIFTVQIKMLNSLPVNVMDVFHPHIAGFTSYIAQLSLLIFIYFVPARLEILWFLNGLAYCHYVMSFVYCYEVHLICY